MKKDKDDWMYQYPSTSVNRKIIGDGDPRPYWAEANKLLYQVKNQMTFNNLGQLRSIRYFNTGAHIIAKSSFGQDFIEIYVPSGEAILQPSCSITLFNIPEVVQPMHWYTDGIHAGEVEGIDYIKTYYTYSVQDCPDCGSLNFTVCDTDQLTADVGLTNVKKCIPFIYMKDGIELREGTINNHCIYSMSGCQAEIIKFDRDEQGSYFIWKAYTEWSNLGPVGVTFSQNGLGYLLLKGFIKLNSVELCNSVDTIVRVDCCEKSADQRALIMYWEKYCVGSEWCPVPSVIPYNTLGVPFPLEKYFIAQPIYGSCMPYEWIFSGSGTFTTGGDSNKNATYRPPPDGIPCNDKPLIILKDRCGSQYVVQQESCCENLAGSVEIGYTTLQMSCSGSQTLTAGGGCEPYSWSLSGGGGTLVDNEDGTALYTAPATNENCAYNPTISLSDCCGGSDSIQIAVNCYTLATEALRYCDRTICVSCAKDAWGYCWFEAVQGMWSYRCNSVLLSSAFQDYPGHAVGSYTCPNPGDFKWGCGYVSPAAPCTNTAGVTCNSACHDGVPSTTCLGWATECSGIPCGTIKDNRTSDMKTQGCCPLNPITGLPY